MRSISLLLMVAVLVHLVTILAIPALAKKNAYYRLSLIAQPQQIVLLEKPKPNSRNFLDLDSALSYGVCIYDLSLGPMNIQGNFSKDPLVLISFHQRNGDIFYSLNDRTMNDHQVNILLMNQSQSEKYDEDQLNESAQAAIKIIAPENSGFMFVRSLVDFDDDQRLAQENIASISCQTAKSF